MTTTIAKKQNGNPSVSFGNVVDNLFQNSLRRFFDDNFWETDTPLVTGSVPVNVRETEQQYEMDVIAPGCRKEDFSVQIEDNMLTISLNHTKDKQEEDRKAGWVRNEYLQRSFNRTFTLDDSVDVSKINATYADGILRLTLQKNEKSKKFSQNVEIK
jgi:HSP20 family protein